MKTKYNIMDLFAGCGGLLDGFLQTEKYNDVASVEWLKPQVNTLRNRLKTRWNVKDADKRVLHFDMQREDELFNGWDNDEVYGSSKGLDHFVNKVKGIDIIIGGPPCQAYSTAGRVRDEKGMKEDYRNYLFEHYLSVVNRYRPKMFVFENVPGMLSAVPDGTPITKLIKDGFESIGYEIIDDIKKYAKINASDFGVPQARKRLIILGIRKELSGNAQELLRHFYEVILPKYESKERVSVKQAIGNLPKYIPILDEESHKKRLAYRVDDTNTNTNIKTTWLEPRYHSLRDMGIFEMLAADLESKECKYTDSKALSKVYEEKVGSKSPIHRYHVLRPDEPSTTIIAHLYKDGNRFIHYESKQKRTITPREAARLQSFEDGFDFLGSRGSVYQMIGNAVPPLLAKMVALAVADLLDEIMKNDR
ncbi:DNA cytosine methyltransferase [Clostridium estertheticum]|uniref:DNA cytosine methyltransferase n=1 Tax=Clostridium estertheticum TaxID=238834 RepID=UPI001C6EA0DF|nr:DNA cytosine methyltransferase [Clostridium estertheticum]MBW9151456.1 DNA cytosine methyltransferase [Clostridium estertheticum]WLC83406.1 DNA cytosine methyltransferase [Clostridium estertheticum]